MASKKSGDSNFYTDLTDNLNDSDLSNADPIDFQQDLSALDDDLFSYKKQPKAQITKPTVNTSLTQKCLAMPHSEKDEISDSYNLNDEIDDILNDEIKPKKPPKKTVESNLGKKPDFEIKTEPHKEVSATVSTPALAPIEPPKKSTVKPSVKDNLFSDDDDDILGAIDSPKKPKEQMATKPTVSRESARKTLDNILGKSEKKRTVHFSDQPAPPHVNKAPKANKKADWLGLKSDSSDDESEKLAAAVSSPLKTSPRVMTTPYSVPQPVPNKAPPKSPMSRFELAELEDNPADMLKAIKVNEKAPEVEPEVKSSVRMDVFRDRPPTSTKDHENEVLLDKADVSLDLKLNLKDKDEENIFDNKSDFSKPNTPYKTFTSSPLDSPDLPKSSTPNKVLTSSLLGEDTSDLFKSNTSNIISPRDTTDSGDSAVKPGKLGKKSRGQQLASFLRSEREELLLPTNDELSPHFSAPTISIKNNASEPRNKSIEKTSITPPALNVISDMEPIMNAGFGPTSFNGDNKLKNLELERDHLQSYIDMLKKNHKEEIELQEEAAKRRLQIELDTAKKREQRLMEENDQLTRQNLDRFKTLEKERLEMREEVTTRMDQFEKEKNGEISRIKEQHRLELETLRDEHHQSLQRLRQARVQEEEALSQTRPTAESLHSVVDKVAASTRDLTLLHSQVSTGQQGQIVEREAAMRAQEDQLKVTQERLRLQENDLNKERERLHDLIAKMDLQMKEQSRQIEEERWSLKQEQNRLAALRKSVEEERSTFNEQISKERKDLDNLKQSALEEQKKLLGELQEERRNAAAIKEELLQKEKRLSEKMQHENKLLLEKEAELDGRSKFQTEEKQRLDLLQIQLKESYSKLQRDKDDLERRERSLQLEKENQLSFERELNLRSQEIDRLETSINMSKDKAEKMNVDAKEALRQQNSKLQTIQDQMQQLKKQEKKISQEKIQLARQREEFEKNKDSLLCSNCRIPVRDTGGLNLSLQDPMHASTHSLTTTGAYREQLLRSSHSSGNGLDHSSVFALSRAHQISNVMEQERQLRLFQKETEKEAEFLEEERAYLKSLQSAPYASYELS